MVDFLFPNHGNRVVDNRTKPDQEILKPHHIGQGKEVREEQPGPLKIARTRSEPGFTGNTNQSRPWLIIKSVVGVVQLNRETAKRQKQG